MKLYTRHGKLLDNIYEMNNDDSGLNTRICELTKRSQFGVDHKNYHVRRQAWLDIDLLGKNYIKMAAFLKGNK